MVVFPSLSPPQPFISQKNQGLLPVADRRFSIILCYLSPLEANAWFPLTSASSASSHPITTGRRRAMMEGTVACNS